MSLFPPYETEPVLQWEVYRYFTTRTTPPKIKMVVIAAVEPEILGFFINTDVPHFIRERQELMPCIVSLNSNYNVFLRYDSHLDCSRLQELTEAELVGNCVGALCDVAIEDVKRAVTDCKVLKQFYKMRILGA